MVHAYEGTLFDLKKKEVLTRATPWMTLKDRMSSEISQSQKETLCDCNFVSEIGRGRKWKGGCRGLGAGVAVSAE